MKLRLKQPAVQADVPLAALAGRGLTWAVRLQVSRGARVSFVRVAMSCVVCLAFDARVWAGDGIDHSTTSFRVVGYLPEYRTCFGIPSLARQASIQVLRGI